MPQVLLETKIPNVPSPAPVRDARSDSGPSFAAVLDDAATAEPTRSEQPPLPLRVDTKPPGESAELSHFDAGRLAGTPVFAKDAAEGEPAPVDPAADAVPADTVPADTVPTGTMLAVAPLPDMPTATIVPTDAVTLDPAPKQIPEPTPPSPLGANAGAVAAVGAAQAPSPSGATPATTADAAKVSPAASPPTTSPTVPAATSPASPSALSSPAGEPAPAANQVPDGLSQNSQNPGDGGAAGNGRHSATTPQSAATPSTAPQSTAPHLTPDTASLQPANATPNKPPPDTLQPPAQPSAEPASQQASFTFVSGALQAGMATPTALGSTTPATPGPPAGPVAGIAVEIVAQAQIGRSRFEIRLDPPELGRIDVRLEIDDKGHVTSHLTVERAETLDLLRRDAPQLERALQAAGLKTADSALEFSLRDQSQGREQHRPAPIAPHLILADENAPPIEIARYGRAMAAGGGLDIRV